MLFEIPGGAGFLVFEFQQLIAEALEFGFLLVESGQVALGQFAAAALLGGREWIIAANRSDRLQVAPDSRLVSCNFGDLALDGSALVFERG
jgi:hypothetical protein